MNIVMGCDIQSSLMNHIPSLISPICNFPETAMSEYDNIILILYSSVCQQYEAGLTVIRNTQFSRHHI